MAKIPTTVFGPHDDIEPGVEVRANSDGSIDEIHLCAGAFGLHLEQMGDDQYWFCINWTDAGGVRREQHVWIGRYGKRIFPTVYR